MVGARAQAIEPRMNTAMPIRMATRRPWPSLNFP
jgi:hypothetical protein